MKTRVVSATEFKAKCLALLDEVEQQADTITITKRGRPVAVLLTFAKYCVGAQRAAPVLAWPSWSACPRYIPQTKSAKSPRGAWAGKVRIDGDIVNADSSGLWGVLSPK
jgi:prevent-host-death family protein